MRGLRQFVWKLLSLVRRSRQERELEKEMTTHLMMIEEDLLKKGAGAEEARFAARQVFGGLEQAKEQYRDQRGFVRIEQFWQDLRHAERGLRKSTGFSAVAVISLALGIGVNVAIFTLVNGILLKRLPIHEADQVVQLEAHGKIWTSDRLSYAQFRELARQTSIFSDVTGFAAARGVLDTGDNSHQIDVELVTGNYFSFFHAQPTLGRLLNEDDDRVEGAHPVCVLSYQTWRSQFGSDPNVLGRVARINASAFEIVGIVGSDFVGGELQRRYDIWVPSAMAPTFMRNARSNPHVIWLQSLAKLQQGLAIPEAHARLNAASQEINQLLPKERANADAAFDFVPASRGFDSFRKKLRQPLLILMDAVLLVLFTACANLINLLLARASERSQEFAVKVSLGIPRWRLMRQLLIESALLAVTGGLVAVVVGHELVQVLLGLFNSGEHRGAISVSMDPAVLLFTACVCIVTTIVVGLYPAWMAIRTDTTPALKGGTATGGHKKFIRRALIVVQVSLAIVLVFGASLFSSSFRKLKTLDLGFDIEHVTVINIDFRGKGMIAGLQPLHDLLNRTRQIPGVESADLANPSMLSGSTMTSDVEARDVSQTDSTIRAENTYFVFVSPGHFSTLRIPLLRGRDFSEHDRKDSPPVAIINQSLASMLWPGQDPIGRRLIGGWNHENPEVVGVVANSKYANVRESFRPIVYEPLYQMPVVGASLEVRSRMTAPTIERQVRRLVTLTAPDFEVANISTMELLRDNVIAQDKFLTFLSMLFGVLGMAVALVGIYGLISHSVTHRGREIGIRMSLGAQRHEVLLLFLREMAILVTCGVVIGVPLALILSKPLGVFLYEVPAADPRGIALTVVLIALGGVAASLLPARRATQVDPIEALRNE